MPSNFVEIAKRNGFNFVKIEIEGDLARGYNDDEESEWVPCEDCENGYVDCMFCDGNGVLRENKILQDCDNCNGDCTIACEHCSGEGGHYETNHSDYSSDEYCKNQIESYMPSEIMQQVVYSGFQYDGTVDSEYQVTLPVEYYESNVDFIKAFKTLGDDIGNGVESDNAGLHITLMPSPNPYISEAELVDHTKIRHFQKEVTKLLPALYFMATANQYTRDMGYRAPQVSLDDKYSAVHVWRERYIEYRIFDPCFDNPEAILEYFETIGKTLRYYEDMSATVELDYEIGLPRHCTYIKDLFRTSEHLKTLEQAVKYVSDKPIDELLIQRGFGELTQARRELAKRERAIRAKARADYRDYAVMAKELGIARARVARLSQFLTNAIQQSDSDSRYYKLTVKGAN